MHTHVNGTFDRPNNNFKVIQCVKNCNFPGSTCIWGEIREYVLYTFQINGSFKSNTCAQYEFTISLRLGVLEGRLEIFEYICKLALNSILR